MTDYSPTPRVIAIKLSDNDDIYSVLKEINSKTHSSLLIFDLTIAAQVFEYFSPGQLIHAIEVFIPIPQLNLSYCKNCGKCAAYCPNKALQQLPLNGRIRLNPDVCNACWKCMKICNVKNALTKSERSIGKLEIVHFNEHKICRPSIKKSHFYASAIQKAWNNDSSVLLLVYNRESVLRLIKRQFKKNSEFIMETEWQSKEH